MTPTKLRNIGPKSAAWLRQVGLRSREDLTATGTVEAFMRGDVELPRAAMPLIWASGIGRPGLAERNTPVSPLLRA